MYSVKEIFYTLQGEGVRVGRPAVFCRFTGCNLWSGQEKDRQKAICKFCDTDFVGIDGSLGGKFETAAELAATIESLWPTRQEYRYVVLTGGEPLLQINSALIDELKKFGFEIAVETNGTIPAPKGIDWLCVSPKSGAPLVQRSGDELKLVYPQNNLLPENLNSLNFKHYLLQPMDGLLAKENTQAAISYCKSNPMWRLSMQTHKILNIR
jgi:7-carboxy-7-deazaguanine synthase (Cx14CxxC type)